MALSSPGAPSTPGCALQIRSDQTSCRKDEGPSPLQLSQNQAAWYASSWRSLQPGASTPGDSRLNTPETTPTSIPTNLLTAPNGGRKASQSTGQRDTDELNRRQVD